MKTTIKQISLGLLSLGILFLLLRYPVSGNYPDVHKYFWFSGLLTGIGFIFCFTQFFPKKFPSPFKKPSLLFLLVVLYHLIHLCLFFSYPKLFHFSLLILFLTFALLLAENSYQYITMQTIQAIGTLLAIYGISQYYGMDFLSPPTAPQGTTLGNSNFMATLLAPLLVFAISQYEQKKGKKQIFFIFIFGFSLYTTKGWAGWLGAFTGFLFLLKQKTAVKTFSSLLLLLTISVTVLWIQFPQYFTKDSNKVRASIYYQTLKLAQSHPWFGVGEGHFENEFRPLRTTKEYYLSREDIISNPESDWLQWLAEIGIIGIALWLFIFGKALYNLKKETPYYCTLVTLFVCGLFNFPMHLPHGQLLLFWLLGQARVFVHPKKTFHSAFFLLLLLFAFLTLLTISTSKTFQQQGIKQLKNQKLQKGITSLQQANQWYPNAESYEILGKIYHRKQEIEPAKISYQKALAIENYRYTTWYQLGILAQQQSSYPPFEKIKTPIQLESKLLHPLSYFETALAINPGYHLAHYQKARFYWKTNKEKALSLFLDLLQEIKKQQKQNSVPKKTHKLWKQTLFDIACLYLQQKKNNEALQFLDELLALDPEYGEALIEKGILLCSQNQLESGRKQLEKAFQIIPNSPRLRFNLGQLYYLKQKYLQAYQYFLPLGLHKNQYQQKARLFLKNICLQLGRKDEALRWK